MILLAIVVVTPAALAMMTVLRCAVAFIPECIDRPWPALFRDWLGEIVPVLVAIVMRGGAPPAPPGAWPGAPGRPGEGPTRRGGEDRADP
jgi:hypothetical protein